MIEDQFMFRIPESSTYVRMRREDGKLYCEWLIQYLDGHAEVKLTQEVSI
jgi:hypothetical protein